MLYWLGGLLVRHFGDGPYRLLSSRLVLAIAGLALTAVCVWWWLPRWVRRLPTDRGRPYAVGAAASQGKPTGVGVIFMPLYGIAALLVTPVSWTYTAVLGCALLAMWAGYLDDRAKLAWSDYSKAAADLGIAFATAWALSGGESVELWLPVYKAAVTVGPGLYLPMATALLWISINATNCTDGVDGLSGSLLLLAFLCLGGVLTMVVGHQDVARYLLVPWYREGADWGIMAFTLSGVLLGYLWYNASPSEFLMGDAGSRPLGLLLGVFVLASGNPALILVVAAVVLVNGGTGLLKIALLRFFRIGIFRSVRFPLHDHCRGKWNWSNTQVLVRFMILQAVLTSVLIALLLKVR
ncbi:MAG: phospho-N-acetylmuramoyl-pentapeptide-transferase [Planctomycetota bacterium]